MTKRPRLTSLSRPTSTTSTVDQLDRIVAVVLLAVVVLLYAAQLRSLFVSPIPNSFRWYGDESWLMQEAKLQLATGIARYPLALGSTLFAGKGLLLGMAWLSSLLYGLPQMLQNGDAIATGRVVTAAISFVLLGGLFACSRMLGARMSVAALAVLLLAANRSFFFASHSARPDMLAGLIVLVVFFIGWRAVELERRFSSVGWAIIGAVLVFLMLTSSIHLLSLLPGFSIFFAWRLGMFKEKRLTLSFLFGGAAMGALLVAIYWGTTHSLVLFPMSVPGAHSQFQDVVASIPILRPFSRSVQVANVVIRGKFIWHEAPQAFLIISLVVWVCLSHWKSVRNEVIALAIVLLSWLLFQSAEVHYLMHVLPTMLLFGAVLWSRFWTKRLDLEAVAALVVAGVFAAFSLRDANAAYQNGSRIARSNDRAVAGAAMAIAHDWKGPGLPGVISEVPALNGLLRYPFYVVTDHFLSFPSLSLPIPQYIDSIGANYIVLYDSPDFPKQRWTSDPFYEAVHEHGKLVDIETGIIGDIGRPYFQKPTQIIQDTLLVYRWN